MTTRKRQRQGVILSVLAVIGVFLLAIVMFFVDVAYMQLTRTELQAVTDAAAKAACEAIDGETTTSSIRQVAIDVAAANQVGGAALNLDSEDIILGKSELSPDGSWLFHANLAPFNAVQIVATKSDEKSSGAVRLFFAGAMGSNRFTPTQQAVASQFDHEVVLCVDRSHSMCFDFSGVDEAYPPAYQDPDWDASIDPYCHRPHIESRWSALTSAVDTFLTRVESCNADQQLTVGLVTWGSEYLSPCTGTTFSASREEVSLGLDFDQIRTVMNQLGSQTMQGATNVYAGLNEGIEMLTAPEANPLSKKTIILFTDGQWNEGSPPSAITSYATEHNITIHVVTLLSNVDVAEMDSLASTNGGVHYNASTQSELIEAFDSLAKRLPVVLTQ